MKRATLPAGPRFWLGHSLSFVYHPKPYYAWLRRRFGEIVTLPTAEGRTVCVLTAEGARQVLTHDPDIYEAFNKKAFTALAGAGSLWVLDGARHRNERRLLSPSFSTHHCRHYGQAILEIAVRQAESWQAGQEINAYKAMLDTSVDVIMRVVFGADRGGLIEDGRNALLALTQAARPSISFVPPLQAGWFPPWIRYRRAKREFATFVTRLLAERRGRGDGDDDVLGLLLSAHHQDGQALSDAEIIDELITILTAGHETTAVALSWALYELGRHPAVLQRLRAELAALAPDADPDTIAQQPYLGAVCNETLRLHTILTEIARKLGRPLELSGYRLPAGTGIAIGIGAIHQDSSLYPSPREFRPERFLERTYTAFEFLPFGGGHRRCLGAALSDYEMRIVLATIVMRWEFVVVAEEQDVRHNIGSGPKEGVRLEMKSRRPLPAPQAHALAQS